MKSLIISVCVLSLIGTAIGITIWSATTGTISATVTARNLAITRSSDGAIAYGTLDLSAVTTTDPSSDINDTETFQNDGSQAKFNIKTDSTTGGSTPWTAGDTAASNVYVHWFATTTGITWQMLDINNTYETATSTIDNGVSLNIYLKFQAPSGSTEYVQKTVPVTVQAAAP